MKTVFFGTPAIAVPYFELVVRSTDLQRVVTSPDEPAGRGYQPAAPPVKQAAYALGIPLLQPASLKDPSFTVELQTLSPELAVVVAYGKLLPPAVLQTARLGFLNVHFSLLPRYRGAAPIQRALIAGEQKTGVTLFWLDDGMDTGPVFLQKELDIAEEDDAESLRQKLIPLGLAALEEALTSIRSGRIIRTAQAGAASLAPPLKKEEGRIDWSQPAHQISNLVRGTTPWPGAFTFARPAGKRQRLKVLKARPLETLPEVTSSTETGGVARLDKGVGFVVKCGRHYLQLLTVQPEGKRPMSGWDYWQGARLKLGDKLG